MSVKQEVNKYITKINRITNSIFNNTLKEWKEARLEAERIVITDLIEGRLNVKGYEIPIKDSKPGAIIKGTR